ncbi:MAG: transposase [Lachnospiraceae bacterium]|nr:transposase [Lachnospiraceae bacterium]
MAKIKRFPQGTFIKQYSTETQCREYLADLLWKSGYAYPRCGYRHAYDTENASLKTSIHFGLLCKSYSIF